MSGPTHEPVSLDVFEATCDWGGHHHGLPRTVGYRWDPDTDRWLSVCQVHHDEAPEEQRRDLYEARLARLARAAPAEPAR